uniref:Uncharacterized protein LOC116286461 n=1 Tax=Actinia tenebrosa TaxID=6105 RepID=A0A6P8GX51_ACTTE
MAEVVLAQILKITVQCFLDKVKDEAANSLRDGDITELRFREMIIRELHDIKSMLRGLVRQDLIASITYFNDGIELLYYHINHSKEEREKRERRREKENECKQAMESLKRAHFMTRNGEQLMKVVEQHVQHTYGENVKSSKTIDKAKENFKQASLSATRAVSNQGMGDEDRILAYKVKIAAILLENFEDPEISIPLCKKALTELNSMTLVTNSCRVHFGKSFSSNIMKRFHFEGREGILRSVASVHRTAWHYIHACAVNKRLPSKTDILQWPLVRTEDRWLHPIHNQEFASFNYWNFGRCASRKAGLNQPTDIAINSLGQFIVSDTNNSRIVLWSCNGTFIEALELTTYDDDEDDLPIRPRGVAVDSQDTIYVCDSVSNRIHVLEKGSKTKSRVIAKPGRYQDRMSNFSGIHVDSDGRILVSDIGMKCVHVFSKAGEYVCNFGREELGFPTDVSEIYSSHIASTDEGNVLVTDARHGCIRVYNQSGLHENISVDGMTFRPVGIAYDSCTGEILVSDHHSKHIFVFSESGEYVRDVGHDVVSGVAGLEATREGHVVLVDDKKSTVHVF